MASRSLFGRIARYGVSPVRNPREDRLTEIWAAIFEHCEGFARHVALRWLDGGRLAVVLGRDGAWRCDVKTQIPATLDEARRRPDLQLTFTGPATVTLWVEVKHGTDPHTGQLRAYCDIQAQHGLRNAVVLLVAPRTDYAGFADDELPSDVPQLSWEETAASIRPFAATSDDPVQRFLLEELWTYMSDEGLTDPLQLTADHLAALEHYRKARQALERLCDLAADRLARTSGRTTERGTYPARLDPREYWWVLDPKPASAALGEAWWWDWKLYLDATDILENAQPRPAVLVGVTGRSRALAALDDDLRELLAARDFNLLGRGSYDYVLKWRYVDGVVGEGDLNAQAAALATWVDDVFTELEAALSGSPPPAVSP